ncbi:MAG: signal recognition particle-docking protein FtsY [Spirochaetia bacterium]|jgi:fused signal recognition particle receptor|nr:signal recognition particle-docking protein FtsY [Spirochaetia bacterium]
MAKISLGQKLKNIFKSNIGNEEFFDNIEDVLVESDMGIGISVDVVKKLKETASKKKISEKENLYKLLKEIISEKILEYKFSLDNDNLTLILFLGVNGVGKTTTIAKTANFIKNKYPDKGIILSAADTFRAAAIDQLKIHGERLGVSVVSQEHGSDPGAVIFDTIARAKSKGEKVILADTAGRMHNRLNLVKELQKIDKIIKNRIDEDNYLKFLVIDSTTGQNALVQTEIFHEAIGIDAIVLAKSDSSARGGIAAGISGKLGIPFVFTGTGEKYSDLKQFSKEEYLDNLLNV